MSAAEQVPLKPVGKEEIRKLEIAIFFTAFSSEEFTQTLLQERRHLTWIDSLYIAAAAFARDRAGVPASKIAEELGVTEETVRSHIKGETKAGQLVKAAYEKVAKEGFKLQVSSQEAEKLKDAISKAKQHLEEALKILSL